MAKPNGRGGWDLTDDDVAEVMEASFGTDREARVQAFFASTPEPEGDLDTIIRDANREGYEAIMARPTPPLGVAPKYIHDARRVGDLKAAIARYKEAGWDVPAAWLNELDDLTDGLSPSPGRP